MEIIINTENSIIEQVIDIFFKYSSLSDIVYLAILLSLLVMIFILPILFITSKNRTVDVKDLPENAQDILNENQSIKNKLILYNNYVKTLEEDIRKKQTRIEFLEELQRKKYEKE